MKSRMGWAGVLADSVLRGGRQSQNGLCGVEVADDDMLDGLA